MFFVRGAYAERFFVTLYIVVAIRHTEAALAEINDVLLAVLHVLIDTGTPYPAGAATFEVRDGADDVSRRLDAFDALQERCERGETECFSLFQIHAGRVKVTNHLLGTSFHCMFLRNNLFQQRVELLVGRGAELGKRTPARLRLRYRILLHPPAARVVKEVILRSHLSINIFCIKPPSFFVHASIVYAPLVYVKLRQVPKLLNHYGRFDSYQ